MKTQDALDVMLSQVRAAMLSSEAVAARLDIDFALEKGHFDEKQALASVKEASIGLGRALCTLERAEMFLKRSKIRAVEGERALKKRLPYAEGEPCGHAGCLQHVSHPCEGCGRIAGRWGHL